MKQRQLTQEEIDKCPEWATHYIVVGERGVLFESKYFYQALSDGVLGGKYQQLDIGVSADAQPIPRKAFDLSKVEWSAISYIISVSILKDIAQVNFGKKGSSLLTKADSIAIAKALGVTAEDFK